jgi:hypothetical protein
MAREGNPHRHIGHRMGGVPLRPTLQAGGRERRGTARRTKGVRRARCDACGAVIQRVRAASRNATRLHDRGDCHECSGTTGHQQSRGLRAIHQRWAGARVDERFSRCPAILSLHGSSGQVRSGAAGSSAMKRAPPPGASSIATDRRMPIPARSPPRARCPCRQPPTRHHDCRTQRASSPSVGRLPYMRSPTL